MEKAFWNNHTKVRAGMAHNICAEDFFFQFENSDERDKTKYVIEIMSLVSVIQ